MNNTASWEEIKEIFSSALELEPGSRANFVSERCAGNAELKTEVESWLASHAASENFIETPLLSQDGLFAGTGISVGRRFGNYEIVREIGHGGMGAVYLAKRTDGEFEQKTALKIVRQTVAESQMIERFRRERQILASLNHPNIARLLDGGVSENGEPFFVMEYVEGEPITDFSKHEAISLDEKLQLFLHACSAVGYAHRNLVVHRDIKPGNILVTAQGEPKLLDFGLAKLLDEDLSGDTTQTAFRALTPAYASPEQLRNEPITTASDIYSLGIVLYELLTSERPFHFEGKSLDEIIRTVTVIDPPPPSSNPESAIRIPQLKGDLDNIVLMSLRKEPERRYQSVEAFAEDIERYLKGLPVAARSATVKYRASKFIQRHKVGVFAAGLIFLSLIGGIIATIRQTRAAEREKEKAEAVNAFLEQTLKYSNPFLNSFRKSGNETTVNEALEEVGRRLENGDLDSQPEVKAELERTIASIYYGQGKYNQARPFAERYVVFLRETFSEDHPKMINGMTVWAGMLFERGEFDEAEKLFRNYLPLLRNEYQKGNVNTEFFGGALNNFAYLRRTQGDSREAEILFRETSELLPQMSNEGRNLLATTRSTLASVIADQGRFVEALETARQAIEEYHLRNETDSPSYGFSLNVLGGFLTENGEYAEADEDLKKAETIFQKYISPTSLWFGDNFRNQATSLYFQNRFDEAVGKADAALKNYEEGFGKHYDNYPTALIIKGLSLTKSGHSGEGERILREALKLRTETLAAGHYWVAAAQGALGECLATQRRFDEAEPLLVESYESLKASQGDGNPRTLLARNRLSNLYLSRGK
ncbi:MAG: protein kinase [Chloracidobacterium sp.]|nr:protein kinase [Chloracidobacterium sp.]